MYPFLVTKSNDQLILVMTRTVVEICMFSVYCVEFELVNFNKVYAVPPLDLCYMCGYFSGILGFDLQWGLPKALSRRWVSLPITTRRSSDPTFRPTSVGCKIHLMSLASYFT